MALVIGNTATLVPSGTGPSGTGPGVTGTNGTEPGGTGPAGGQAPVPPPDGAGATGRDPADVAASDREHAAAVEVLIAAGWRAALVSATTPPAVAWQQLHRLSVSSNVEAGR
jgi:hypothetical protein